MVETIHLPHERAGKLSHFHRALAFFIWISARILIVLSRCATNPRLRLAPVTLDQPTPRPVRRRWPWCTARAEHDGVVNIPPLPSGTILLVEVGSTAHGTG